MKPKFEIGQWVESTDGIGQVLFVRRIFSEKYTTEFFDGMKVGEYLYDILVIKLLCDHDGKARKRNRIVAENSKFCKEIGVEAQRNVKKIKMTDEESYSSFIFYDEKRDLGWSHSIFFNVPYDSVFELQEKVKKINQLLPDSFTLREFLNISKDQDLGLDFSKAEKYVPGAGLNFSINLFNRMYKVVGKQRIYTKVWSRAKTG